MKLFHCNNCGQPIFFENTQCVKCKRTLGYLLDQGRLSALTAAQDSLWTSVSSQAQNRVYRMCQNYSEAQVGNWVVPVDDVEPIASAG